MLARRSLLDIAERFGGTLWSRDGLAAVPTVEFGGVSIDSRSVAAGDLFVAVQGDKYDGHQFIAEAQETAAALVVSRPQPESSLLQWIVEDTTAALGQLAQFEREHFEFPVIALTGSSGKSSVKEMCAAILGCKAPTLATVGNLNNQFGAPLTLLAAKPEHRYGVIELGASRVGDISELAVLVNADVALVNNIQPAHVEGFGSLEAIAQEKSAIYRQLSAEGCAVINLDEPFAAGWLADISVAKVVTFSRRDVSADFCAKDVAIDAKGCAHFTLTTARQKVPVTLSTPGLHQVGNALAAAALTSAVGAELMDIAAGLSAATTLSGRLTVEKITPQLTLIDDSYNANPGSVAAAVDLLSGMRGLRILVLGDMAELGDQAQEWHKRTGIYAVEKSIDSVFSVGELAALAADAAHGQQFDSREDCLQRLLEIVAQAVDLTVLVKGSRSAGMDKLCAQLRAEVCH
ncbi:MAG: UDP-N-acetylmuramoyl-tripeptide--D-alanyl-D-alanine ligase [Porticoccaceae bacterium]